MIIYRKISNLLPKKTIDALHKQLIYGGFTNINPRDFAGFLIFFAVGLLAATGLISNSLLGDPVLKVAAPILTTIVILGIIYLLLLVAIDVRAKQIEEVLPNALQIMASNIKAGMTLENAVWSTARPELGKLSEEIQQVAADTFIGNPISTSMKNMSNRVKSKILERAVNLIVNGIALGGTIGRLLEEVAEDIRNQKLLENEIVTATTTYTLFVIFAAVFAAPALFAASVYYSEANEKLFKATSENSVDISKVASQTPLQGLFRTPNRETSIKITDITLFAIISITTTNLFAALILGTIRHGKALKGISFILPFILIALGIFALVLEFLRNTFGSLIV